MTKILICDGIHENVWEKLNQVSSFNVFPKKKISEEEFEAELPETEGIVIRSRTKLTGNVLSKAKKLKYIIRAGAGVDNIDLNYCRENSIAVSNTPGANNNSAAEHAVALMMSVLRHTATANESMHSGNWNKAAFVGNELAGKKVGILGYGRIGKIVAKRISGFECEVSFYDPFFQSCPENRAKKIEDLDTFLKSQDIISLHTPYNKHTHMLLNEEKLKLLPKHSILINCSRGKIVDETALIKILESNQIRGAGFDVFEIEPLPEDSPLRKLSNIVLTPHIAASTDEAQLRVGEMALEQLISFFEKNGLKNSVL